MVVAEKEQAVATNGAANGSTELILAEVALRQFGCGVIVRPAIGVEDAVAGVLPCTSMESIGTALGGRSH
ncbi:MAG TPA: hypothetical protein VGE93_13525, partial [Bryobacteraceae bacterium]